MNFDDAEKLIEKARKRSLKAISIIVVIILFTIMIAYTTSYFSKKAEQRAASPPTTPSQIPKNGGVDIRTEGDQSPAIHKAGEGSVTINYEGDK
jgi:hypothetical protein